MIVYGSLTNNSIGKLFIAGIIPGVLLSACFMVYIALSAKLAGETRSPEPRVPLATKLKKSIDLVPPLVIFGIVMGSLYSRHRDADRERGSRRGHRARLRLASWQVSTGRC